MTPIESWESFIRIHGGEPGARYAFEKLIDDLLRWENAEKEVHIVRASQGDGGIDVYVTHDEGIDIYQCKFFMGNMTDSRWANIQNSFKKAMENTGVSILNWRLCMPREMQKEDIARFNRFYKKQSSFHVNLKVIDGNEIINRMEECDKKYNAGLIDKYFNPYKFLPVAKLCNPKKEVFISYTLKRSYAIAQRLCLSLEKEGITCWIAHRDEIDGDETSIPDAIRNCKIFIQIIDEETNESKEGFRQTLIAHERFKNNEKIILLPFKVATCQLNETLLDCFGKAPIIDVSTESGIIHLEELIFRVKTLLERTDNHMLQTDINLDTRSSKKYRLVSDIVLPDKHFIGRKEELKRIHQQMKRIDNKLFLVGMAGVGKTEIAKMYIKTHSEEYDVILFVPFTMSLQHTLANDDSFPIDGILWSDYPLDTEERYAERKLRILKRISSRRILIVIDNFDVINDPYTQKLCSGQYSVIFTTRYHQSESNINELDIQPILDETERIRLFCADYDKDLTDKELYNITKINSLLEGHTLTIRLMASTMRSKRISPTNMLEILEAKNCNPHIINRTVADSIFNRLRDVFRIATLNTEELYILRNLALYTTKGIDVKTFCHWCEIEDYNLLDSLIQRNWIIHDSAHDFVHLHPLIADIMAEQIKESPDCCNIMLNNFYEVGMNAAEKSYSFKLLCHEISSTFWSLLPEDNTLRGQMLETKIAAIFDLGNWWDAFSDCKMLISYSDKRVQKLYGYSMLAMGYSLLKRPNETLIYFNQGYSLVKNLSPDELTEREGYLRCWILLRAAEAYNMLGNYDKSLSIANKCLEYCDIYYKTSIENARCKVSRHIASSLFNLGLLKEGSNILLYTIQYFEETGDFRAAANSYEKLGLFLAQMGDYKEAIQKNDKAIEYLIPLYGAENISIANALEIRAQIYSIAKDKENALKYWNKAIRMFAELGAIDREQSAKKDLDNAFKDENWHPILI